MENNSNVEARYTERLIGTETVEITYDEALEILADELDMSSFGSVNEAILAVGITAVLVTIKDELKQRVVETLSLVTSIIIAIKEAIDNSDFTSQCRQLEPGKKLVCTINNYEWLSGSGNHTAYFSETSYEIVNE